MTPGLRLLPCALGFALGILVFDALPPARVGPAAALAGAAALLALGAAWRLQRRRRAPRLGEAIPAVGPLAAVLLVAGLAFLGGSIHGLHRATLRRAVLPALAGRVVSLTGSVAEDPARLGRATAVPLAVRSVEGRPARERAVLLLYGKAPAMAAGDRLHLETKVLRLDRSRAFDRSLARRGVSARGVVVSRTVLVVGRASNPALRLANHVRARLEGLVRRALAPAEAGLALGLTIGDERLIPGRVVEDFRTSGLSHLLAVSGANVAIVVGAVVALLRLLRASRMTQVLASLAAVGFFSLVTRWEPSVLRAALMSGLALAAFFAGRRADALHNLGIVFMVLLAVSPGMLWSIGFQLSFAATLGILVLGPVLRSRLGEIRGMPASVAAALSIALSAQLAVSPLLVVHFGRLSLVALPANLVALPLVAPATLLGLGAAVLGTVCPPAGQLLLAVAGPLLWLLGSVARVFASLPLSSLSLPSMSPLQALALLLFLGAPVLAVAGRRRFAAGFAAGGLIALILRASLPGPAPPELGMRLTFFDVGQGDSALAESAGGARVLVDGGPDREFVADRLQAHRVDRLDLVVFSHAHVDHVNGLPAVLRHIPVRSAIAPGPPGVGLGGAPLRPVEMAAGAGFEIGDLRAEVIAPDRSLVSAAASGSTGAEGRREGTALNDASLVLRVRVARGCAVFAGDIEEEGQRRLVERYGSELRCGVLKAPHHGSARLLPEFVEAVAPRVVVVSVGENDYGHPARSALAAFARAGAVVLRTDRLHDIVLEVDPAGMPHLRG
ncbi:MAG: ComEC/Rec2 family competence protein [Actinomycetota bacterium]